MGWRERDYARFTRKEWHDYTGRGETASRGSSSSPKSSSFLRQPVGWPLMAAVSISVVASVVFGWGHITSLVGGPTSTAQSLANPAPGLLPVVGSKVIGIRWRTTDLAPATQAGRICVTATEHGRICASYVVGERPADTLTRRIESLGLRVESSG